MYIPSPRRTHPTALHRNRQSQDFLRLWQASVDQAQGGAGRASALPSSPAAMLLDSLSIGHESVLRPAEQDFLQARGLSLDGGGASGRTSSHTRGWCTCELLQYCCFVSSRVAFVRHALPRGCAAFVARLFSKPGFRKCTGWVESFASRPLLYRAPFFIFLFLFGLWAGSSRVVPPLVVLLWQTAVVLLSRGFILCLLHVCDWVRASSLVSTDAGLG